MRMHAHKIICPNNPNQNIDNNSLQRLMVPVGTVKKLASQFDRWYHKPPQEFIRELTQHRCSSM